MSTKVSKLPVVGYRKPPVHSRFRKGQSGNPGGRPKGMTSGRAAALMQQEAYRRIRVKEGDKVVTMTVFQAVLRSLIARHEGQRWCPACFSRLGACDRARERQRPVSDRGARNID